MKKIDIVLTGASGLLGRSLYRQFKENCDWQISGLAFQRATSDLVKLDLLEQKAVENYIRKRAPAVIIHSAAERRPDISRDNPELTRSLNVTATEQLVKLAQETGAWFVYLSTDYVFDGKKPPYSPKDLPHPLNLYGETKYQGELIVKENLTSYLILRVPILYGEVEYLGESAVTDIADTLVKAKRQGVRIDKAFDNWAIRYPTYTGDVAVVLQELIEYKLRNPTLTGTYHWSGARPMTKYEMALVMADILQLDPTRLRPQDQPSGEPRPRNAHLDISETRALVPGRQSIFEEKIRHVLRAVAAV
jgi:dTDP-4-dehydrorhamnose reductase